MSSKTAILERKQSREGSLRNARYGAATQSPELPEEEIEDSFDREPTEDLLQLYDSGLAVASAGFPEETAEPVLSSADEEELEPVAAVNMLVEDESPRHDESLQIWMS